MDELRPIPFHELRNRLLSFGVNEEVLVDGARTFYRPVIGLGTPYISVAYRGEDAIVYPVVIESLIITFGIPRDRWIAMDIEAA